MAVGRPFISNGTRARKNSMQRIVIRATVNAERETDTARQNKRDQS